MARALATLALAVLLSGCYRYTPARMGSVPAGTEVRLQLSDEGARRMETFTGSRRARVSGELIQWTEDVVVSVGVPASEGMVDRDLRQRIVVAEDEVVGVEVRERDRTRTAVLVGGAVTLVTTALITAFSGEFGRSGGDEPPPTHEEGVVIPAWPGVFR